MLIKNILVLVVFSLFINTFNQQSFASTNMLSTTLGVIAGGTTTALVVYYLEQSDAQTKSDDQLQNANNDSIERGEMNQKGGGNSCHFIKNLVIGLISGILVGILVSKISQKIAAIYLVDSDFCKDGYFLRNKIFIKKNKGDKWEEVFIPSELKNDAEAVWDFFIQTNNNAYKYQTGAKPTKPTYCKSGGSIRAGISGHLKDPLDRKWPFSIPQKR